MNVEWMKIYEYWKQNGQVVEEEAMFKYIQQEYPNWIPRYHHCLRKARRAVLKKLVEAFIRENIGGIVEHFHQQLPSGMGKLFPSSYRYYPVDGQKWLVFPIGRRYAFNRYQLEGELLLAKASTLQPIEHVVEWLALVYPQLSKRVKSDDWGTLIKELCNAGANQALSYLWQEVKEEKMQQLGNTHLRKLTQAEVDNHSLFFEQLCTEGHHLHPCAKTKLGFAPEEVDRYSPECQNQPFLQFVAVHRDFVESTWSDSKQPINAFIFQFFPELENRIPIDQKKYQLIPVHGWQMEHTIPNLYQEEIAKKIIVLLPEWKIPAVAMSSVRTLYPRLANDPIVPFTVKVAVNSQMTSTVRSISPQTAMNSRKFTLMMQEVMRREPQLQEVFVPIYEIGGCYFKSTDPLKKRNLSVVFREGWLQEKDEVAIVASALYHRSPFSGKSILADLVKWYAESRQICSERLAAEQFMVEYIRIALSGYLTLMVKYGIGLEGHMQNSVPVFRQGQPVKMMVRDWGGARIFHQRLQKQGFQVDFYPDSLTITSKIEKMYEKVFYTVYQSHLGELILQLCHQFDLSEERLWQQVGRMSEEIFHSIAQNPLYTEQAKQDRAFLFQKEMPMKALTLMRLFPDREQYIQVPNPLGYQKICSPAGLNG